MTVNKANKVLGSIKRSVGTANVNVFSMLYKFLVRPILEYAAPVWCPYLAKDIHALESVQRRVSTSVKETCLMKIDANCLNGPFYPIVEPICL